VVHKKRMANVDIINMLENLIDNIFVMFGERVFQKTVGTNCAHLLAEFFLYSYEEDSMHDLLKKREKKQPRSFNFMFHFIDDVLLLNIKNATDTDRSGSYIELHFEIDSEGRLRTKLYDKIDDFNVPIVNCPFICSNIPAAPAYGVYISELRRYSKAYGSYQDFLDRGFLLTRKLLNQRSLLVKF
jgi:hypothetical protein